MSGVGGVPFFVFGKKIAVAGAHEPEVLAQAIDQALAAKAKIRPFTDPSRSPASALWQRAAIFSG
jgi:predicted DsbA family dithiol-disulfide isomerase